MSKFNAISYEQELEAAGVPKTQAAVHARVLGELMNEVVFSNDLRTVEHNLRKEIAQTEQRLSERIDSLRDTLNARIDSVKFELNAKIEMLGARISAVEHELTVHRWLFALVIILQASTLAAVIKLLPH